MGAWGSGNFDDDRALDFVFQEVQQPLLKRVRSMVAKPILAEADERSGPIMAAIEILALLSEQVKAAPPEPDEVAIWKTTFLGAWDRTAIGVYSRQEDAAARRSVIVATFDRLALLAARFHRPDAEKETGSR